MSASNTKNEIVKASRRRRNMRSILLGVLIGLALVFAVFAGRYVYGKSKDPNFRLADLFGAGRQAESASAEFFTLPENDIAILISSGEAGTARHESEETSGAEETALPSASAAEEPSGTEETAGDPPETTAAEVPDTTTQEPAETTLEETTAVTSEAAPPETPAVLPTEPASETAEKTEPATSGEPALITDPSDIRYHLRQGGMEEDELGSCRQLVAVQSKGTKCSLYFFEKTDGGWKLSETPAPASGIVGRNGVTVHKVAKDGCTPAGYYGLGPCYGEYAQVQTKMDYRQITEHDLWIGYNDSGYYNELIYIEDMTKNPWVSYEHLIEYMPYYRYLAVIRYNMDPVVPYAGAAIFLHCEGGDQSTSGCVGTGEDVMREIFAWLDPACDPHILIY